MGRAGRARRKYYYRGLDKFFGHFRPCPEGQRIRIIGHFHKFAAIYNTFVVHFNKPFTKVEFIGFYREDELPKTSSSIGIVNLGLRAVELYRIDAEHPDDSDTFRPSGIRGKAFLYDTKSIIGYGLFLLTGLDRMYLKWEKDDFAKIKFTQDNMTSVNTAYAYLLKEGYSKYTEKSTRLKFYGKP